MDCLYLKKLTMAKAELKTKPQDTDVETYLNSVENGQRRKDAFKMLEIMKEISGKEPVMWGGSIIGFGDYHYKYKSGREGDFFEMGFSPRKTSLSVYIMSKDGYPEYPESLGKFKTGKSCLYIKKMEDINEDELRRILKESLKDLRS